MDDSSIRFLMKQEDRIILSKLFEAVSAQRFAAHTDLLVQKCGKWQHNTAGEAFSILMQIAPDTAAGLLEDFCKNGKKLFHEFRIWESLVNNFSCLPKERQKDLAFTVIASYRKVYGEKGILRPYGTDTLKLAMTYAHPETEALFRHCLFTDDENYPYRLQEILKALGLPPDEYRWIHYHMEGDDLPRYSEIRELYEIPLPEDLEKVIAKIGKSSFKETASFFEKHKELIRNEQIRTFFENLIADSDFLKKLHKKEQQPYVYAMLVGAVMASLRKERPEPEKLSLQKAAELAAADMEELPGFESFVSFFKNRDKEETVTVLTESLKKSLHHYGGRNIIRIMGELNYDEFLRNLCDALEVDPDYEFIYLAASKALLKYGKRAVEFLTDHVEKMDDITQTSVLETVRKIGGPEALEFTDRHFDMYMRMEKEFILNTCEALCNENCLKKISKKINKNQHLIDRTWLTVTLLTRGKTGECEKLLKDYYQHRKKQNALIESVMSGSILDEPRPYAEAELECKNCGDRSNYRLYRIFMSEKGKHFIGQEIECINCETLADFEITDKGRMALTGESMRLMLAAKGRSKKEAGDAYENSPIRFGKTMAMGKVMEIDEAIETYRKAIEKNPKDAAKHIGLANIYYFMNMFTRASELYQQAAETDPLYIQAYYSLARMEEDKGDAQKALEWMEKGIPYLDKARYYSGSGPGKEEFLYAYKDYYNTLLDETGSNRPRLDLPDTDGAGGWEDERPLQPVRTGKKIGRNEPCPCGSGKKYKKCCLK